MYRKRCYKRLRRLLGTLLGGEGGWAFIKAIYLLCQYMNELPALIGSVGGFTSGTYFENQYLEFSVLIPDSIQLM